MKLYNTMSMQKEEFVPIEPGKVRMYACGPTVYNYIHVGNARPIIMFDVLRRYLEYRGYEVTFVQNFTDVDDKIIKRANEEGISSEEVAKKYIAEYFTDAHALGVREATVHPKATENIQQIIDLITTLIDKGYAYEVNGDVYYRTLKFKDYGKLSHQPIEDLQSGARIDVNDIKENPLDFALWKAAKPGEPSWPSPWGEGRPGWHTECAAMVHRYLGTPIDIHGGGSDLAFPHHENECAQATCAWHQGFSNTWMHTGMLLVDGEKMSKSRGNVVNPNDIVAQYGADTMRLHIMFIGDFEKAVSWSNEAVKGSKRFLDRCFNLQDIATAEESISAKNESIVHKTIKKVSQDIDELKMNTAIAAMMTMVNEFYANGCSKGDVEMLCLLLSPFAPHMVEEMWENMGFAAKYGKMAMQMDWPEHDEAKTVDSHVEMAVQVNGKLKGTVTVPVDSDEAAVVAAAMESDKVKKATEGMSVVKTILVRNKLVNLIVKPAK